MSHYITRFCGTHSEWDMDVDNVGDCPQCEKAGLTETQQLKDEIESLRQQNKTLEGNIEEKRNECMNLRQQLASKDAVICGMREALHKHEGLEKLRALKTQIDHELSGW